jgi:hypothetical protein
MAVEVVGRDVEENADRRLQGGRELDLEGGHLDHVATVRGRRLKRQHRGADVAAHLHVAARRCEDVRREGGRRRFAVGAGDGDERRLGCDPRALAGVKLNVADDLHVGCPGLAHDPVRLGMGERHARRQHQGGEAAPVGGRQVLHRDAGVCGRLASRGAVVAGHDLGPAGDQRPAARQA